MSSLLSCPFCGGEARLNQPTCTRKSAYNPADRAFPTVSCSQCHAEAWGEDWDQRGTTAIAAWNRRVPTEQAGHVAAEAYQVIGALSDAWPDHPEITRALDYFSRETFDGSILPFALPAAPVAPTWNPDMSAAPRDGTPVDLAVCWPDKVRRWADAKWLEEGVHSCSGPANWCHDRFPLHAFTEKPVAIGWMRAPALPTPPQAGECS